MSLIFNLLIFSIFFAVALGDKRKKTQAHL